LFGLERVVPKTILQIIKVPYLAKEDFVSH